LGWVVPPSTERLGHGSAFLQRKEDLIVSVRDGMAHTKICAFAGPARGQLPHAWHKRSRRRSLRQQDAAPLKKNPIPKLAAAASALPGLIGRNSSAQLSSA